MTVTLTDEQALLVTELIEDVRRDLMMVSVAELITLKRADAALDALTRDPAPAAEPSKELGEFAPAPIAPASSRPASCQHRELLEEAREALVRSCAYVHENRSDIVTDNQEVAQRIDAALAQPCAAPGEEWECVVDDQAQGIDAQDDGIMFHKDGQWETHSWREGDRVRVYRRRAPAREGGDGSNA